MGAVTFEVKAPPYGMGTATSRLFSDGTTVTPYKQNAIVVLSTSVFDASQVQQQVFSALGIGPGVYWYQGAKVSGGSGNTGKYVIDHIVYSHSKAQDTAQHG